MDEDQWVQKGTLPVISHCADRTTGDGHSHSHGHVEAAPGGPVAVT